jgi:CheY-like chemotaxis protein
MWRYVSESAYRFVFANLSKDALVLTQHKKPAAILIEVGHSGTIGWRILHALKADQMTSKIPVVICFWLIEKKSGIEERADVYLRMPILYENFQEPLAKVGIPPCA